MTLKKRNRIVTSVAVSLAAVLLIGGTTITYLSSTSETVVNTFNTNEINVELKETGAEKDDEGNITKDDYEIIPGTSEEKDPTVTLTSTVDSYLYVLVYENNPTFTYTVDEEEKTENTILYAIEDGWQTLDYDYDSDGDEKYDSYSNAVLANFGMTRDDLVDSTTGFIIYYREVSASESAQTFHILKGDLVSYSPFMDGDNLENYADGDIWLAFAAYAIQQQPFSNAENAITQTAVDDVDDLTTAIKNGEAVTLSSDITVDATELNSALDDSNVDTVIDLNGATLTIEGVNGDGVNLAGESLSLSNGTVEYKGSSTVAFAVESGSSLTLDNVTLDVDSTNTGATSAINIEGSSDNATLTIRNSIINSDEYFALSTNASTPASSNVTVVIENSTLSTSVCNGDPETTGILFNVPGTLTITDSTITGGSQGVIVRGGTANITNSTIKATITGDGADVSKFSTTMGYLDGTDNWRTGNQLPAAALVVGNHSASAYEYETDVTLEDVTLTVGGEEDKVPAIYAAQSNSNYSTTLTGADENNTILYYVGSSCSVSVNGSSLSGTGSELTTVSALSGN